MSGGCSGGMNPMGEMGGDMTQMNPAMF